MFMFVHTGTPALTVPLFPPSFPIHTRPFPRVHKTPLSAHQFGYFLPYLLPSIYSHPPIYSC